MPKPPSDVSWHADGHYITTKLDKYRFVVRAGECPTKGDSDAACYHPEISGNCLVNHFVSLYGLELNQGVAEPKATMEIAWARFGSHWNTDDMQVWIIPTTDEAFAAWFDAETEEHDGE